MVTPQPARWSGRHRDEALTLYRTMVEIEPDSAVTHSNVGATLFRLGRLEEALASIERTLALDPDLEIARVRQQVRQALTRRERDTDSASSAP